MPNIKNFGFSQYTCMYPKFDLKPGRKVPGRDGIYSDTISRLVISKKIHLIHVHTCTLTCVEMFMCSTCMWCMRDLWNFDIESWMVLSHLSVGTVDLRQQLNGSALLNPASSPLCMGTTKIRFNFRMLCYRQRYTCTTCTYSCTYNLKMLTIAGNT